MGLTETEKDTCRHVTWSQVPALHLLVVFLVCSPASGGCPRLVSVTPLIQHLLCAHWLFAQAVRSVPPAGRATGTERAAVSTDGPQVLVVSGGLAPEATFKTARILQKWPADSELRGGNSVSQGSSWCLSFLPGWAGGEGGQSWQAEVMAWRSQ